MWTRKGGQVVLYKEDTMLKSDSADNHTTISGLYDTELRFPLNKQQMTLNFKHEAEFFMPLIHSVCVAFLNCRQGAP